MLTATSKKKAVLYRMVMKDHICPFGLKSLDLLKREGYEVEDHWLRTREETNSFQKEHGVETTPQTFINDARIGGNDDLRRFLGKDVRDPQATSYRPILTVFVTTALMSVAANWASGSIMTVRVFEWFIAFSMCVLAILKLRDLESFSNMFLGYDLLARRWVGYAYLYPFGEALAGVLMVAGALVWLSAPIAFFIGAVGSWSVYQAVYIEKRELKCACVGGDSNVPLGVVSLTENLMMVAMALWMITKAVAL
ncbi:glutaredoxin [Rhizobium leguminosarum]|uniref:MauE/DoxX family redox-associated membrane protein n=1 Tax=Rhizobium leguminosarum TaxID=384 RepID=UPI001C96BF71|nr:glutaredoxin [Rhizobium leguminosarum]MBY5371823.1 glutaredoxin [Rhizobium leguminosarum]MBY5447500.1 glutaredoxin [Rhizobium leguminosarum]